MTAKNPEAISGDAWAGERGDKWLENLDVYESMIAPIGDAALAAAAATPGELALDIGCGGGASTLALARSTAPAGGVTGLDISSALAGATLDRATKAGAPNVSVIVADAARARLQPRAYDLLFSRFGVMFFDDPVAAFRNLRGAMKDDGRLVFVCWADPHENEWTSLLLGALARHVDLPRPDPLAPGPFAFADKARVEGILTQAGFRAVHFKPWRGVHHFAGDGATPETAADFAISASALGDIVREQTPPKQAAIRGEFEKALRPRATRKGVELNAFVWLVSARG